MIILNSTVGENIIATIKMRNNFWVIPPETTQFLAKKNHGL
jgi:hypothetical protein